MKKQKVYWIQEQSGKMRQVSKEEYEENRRRLFAYVRKMNGGK